MKYRLLIRNYFISIAVVLFATHANAEWNILKDVIDAVENSQTILNKKKSENKPATFQEPKTTLNKSQYSGSKSTKADSISNGSDILIKNSRVENMIEAFMERCIPEYGQSACECSLRAESNKKRNMRKKRLQLLEKKVDQGKKGLFRVPGMTKNIVETICHFDDSIADNRWKATLAHVDGDGQKFKNFQSTARDKVKQRWEFIQNFIAKSPKIGSALKNSKYFKSRTELNMIKNDLAGDDKILYPEVSRRLITTLSEREGGVGHDDRYYFGILKEGRKMKCLP